MERFTNNHTRFFDQIKIELLDFIKEDWRSKFVFLQVSQMGNHGFSLRMLSDRKQNSVFLFKQWKADFDNERFSLGIYNLDRLAIAEEVIKLSQEEYNCFDSLIAADIGIIEPTGIVLDGLLCELEISDPPLSFKWNTDQEMNEPLSRLVNILRDKAVLLADK